MYAPGSWCVPWLGPGGDATDQPEGPGAASQFDCGASKEPGAGAMGRPWLVPMDRSRSARDLAPVGPGPPGASAAATAAAAAAAAGEEVGEEGLAALLGW